MESSSNEKKIVMALEVFKKNLKFTIQTASRIYEVFHMTLMEWHAGKQLRNNILINSKKFTNLEKKVILDCIIKLVDWKFLLKQKNVWNIVDSLCNAWYMFHIGLWWAENFV